ncbi:MAG: phosphate ABC transporter permease subunit PstC [Planctomycetota bacterium]
MTASITTGDGLKAMDRVKLPGRPKSTLMRDLKERSIVGVLVVAGGITISITILIVVILAQQAAGFFGGGIQDVQGREANVSLTDFLFALEWNPLQGSEKEFGIWPLIVGTFQVTIVAMCIAIPVGLMVAIWLSEFASPKVRSVMKPIIEVIAGVPTVVFGYFALTFVTPLLQLDFAGIAGNPNPNKANPLDIQIFNVLAAGLTVGIMCIPIVTSLSEDALRAVPRALREGSYGLGASRFETSVKVVFPAALSGIVAACLLAFARAVGETMIVAIAAGLNPPDLASGLGNVFAVNEPTQTMTGYMVSVFFGDLATGTVEYQSVYAVGMTLFVVTLCITICGSYVRRRFRQQYE